MNNYELAVKLVDIAKKYKTLYVLGCFGAPLTSANKKRYINAYAYNQGNKRRSKINAASADTFGFDCVNLIKGCLWGWKGDKNANYGGATYQSNGVPDIGADAMISKCKDISTDFKKIEVGEAVWLSGHIGIYIGGGLAVECTPKWEDKVQITACNCVKKGYNTRTWTKHGKLPYITYIPEGDIDADGKVTAADARLALRAAVGLEHFTEAQKKAGDTDGDGKNTSSDARDILRKSVGLK
ncbi:MAG: hypothetical protein IJS90_02320 [Clostridia bacterium]|nr:hypothetical protein [Clostridia bacterium]